MAKKGQKFNKYTTEFRSKVVMENINQGKSYTSLGKKNLEKQLDILSHNFKRYNGYNISNCI
jgi:hypothetical protein